jgi:hypothetical protein
MSTSFFLSFASLSDLASSPRLFCEACFAVGFRARRRRGGAVEGGIAFDGGDLFIVALVGVVERGALAVVYVIG